MHVCNVCVCIRKWCKVSSSLWCIVFGSLTCFHIGFCGYGIGCHGRGSCWCCHSSACPYSVCVFSTSFSTVAIGYLVPFVRIASNVVYVIIDYYSGALASLVIWVVCLNRKRMILDLSCAFVQLGIISAIGLGFPCVLLAFLFQKYSISSITTFIKYTKECS